VDSVDALWTPLTRLVSGESSRRRVEAKADAEQGSERAQRARV